MRVLELKQGHRGGAYQGVMLEDALLDLRLWDDAFLERHPQTVTYHQPPWRVLDVADDRTAPWGHEWYAVDDDGRLQFHSADYDSSG